MIERGLSGERAPASMARMDRLAEVDAGEDGEDVGLQEGDQ